VDHVETARGAVEIDQLGHVLMHEHVFTLDVEFTQNYPEQWEGDDQRVDDAVAKLDALKRSGIDTIVDLTVFGLGRYVPRIQQVAERAAVRIILATGIYTFDEVPRPARLWGPRAPLGGVDRMAELFIREIREGIGDTGVRAAILKCATGEPGVTAGVDRVLRAVATAHLETGVPITTHTVAKKRHGLDQQRVFLEEGVDLRRVIIGHCGDAEDVGYLRELAAAGSYLGMDQFGVDFMSTFDDRVSLVSKLCHEGLADHLILSNDFACYADIIDDAARAQLNPRWSYTLITEAVVPALRQQGVSDEDIEQMLVINPRRIFRGDGAGR
jgi:phosphotriesterase-related protein